MIAAAGTAGVTPELSNLDATLPAVFAIMTFLMWNWWSVYLSGELKSGSDRRRQLSVMFGGLLWDGVFIVMGLVLFFNVIPYDLAAALNTSGNEAYAIPSGPWYQFLASLVQNIGILAVIILGSFLFWSLPAMVGNTFMPIRSVFAWAFDRLLPEKLAEVNERTHSPVPAILLVMTLVTAMLAWSVLSTDFFTWLALGVEGRRGLRDHRGHRRHPVPDPPTRPLPGLAGEREVPRLPAALRGSATVDPGHVVPGLADGHATRGWRWPATRTTYGRSPPSWG